MQLPNITAGLGNYSVGEAILYALIISLITIIVRIMWVFPGAYLPRYFFKSIRENEPKPGWRSLFLIGWSGMRGVVSLASAMAIPLTIADNVAFPHRNLILFITFVVILVTLVLQGLSLKPIIRKLKIEESGGLSDEMKNLDLKIRLAESVLSYLDSNYLDEMQNHETYKRVRERYERMISISRQRLESNESQTEDVEFLPRYRQMLIELIHIRRGELNYFRHKAEFSEELIREREWELDLEEARLGN